MSVHHIHVEEVPQQGMTGPDNSQSLHHTPSIPAQRTQSHHATMYSFQ